MGRRQIADTLERRTSMLGHYMRRRVSQTASGIIRCITPLAQLVYDHQPARDFTKLFVHALKASWDRTSGTRQIDVYDDGTIWIEGSFHIDELRKRLIAVPQPTLIEMERTDG